MRGSIKLHQGLSFALALGVCAVAQANPLGPNVVHGNVDMFNPSAGALHITNTPGSVVEWQSFSIDAGEVTQFIQESADSAILNRVTGTQLSEILGNLTSNGRVFLINGNGIVVGEGATIDTAGLVMSTLDITNEDFIAGRFNFRGDENSGSIVNHGYIKTAPGGEVILLAPHITNETIADVENSGLIETEDGELILAAGYAINITSLDDPDISFEVQASEHEVVNLGRLIASGGSAEILAGTIRHSGEINADTLKRDDQGRIRLVASHYLETGAESITSANAPDDGGTIRIEGIAAGPEETPSTVILGGQFSADGGAIGGRIEMLGDELAIADATITANGELGGGEVRVGGEIQGGSALPSAEEVNVSGASRISADALNNGDGGSVAVWSNERTEFNGYASARGGNAGGDGGFVEISGKAHLAMQGSLDVGALNGKAGKLLLDPEDVFIIPESDATALLDPTPQANDRLGSGITILPNGNILIRNQNADVGGLVDAGEIFLFNPDGDLLGLLSGTATNERLGSLFQNTVADGNLVFRSPNAGAGMRGAVILFNDDTGMEIGRVSGASVNEQLGLVVDFFGVPANSYVIRSSLADVGGLVDAGSLIAVNQMTGLETARISGTAAGDLLGNRSLVLATSGNYFLPVPNADNGAVVDAGSLFLVGPNLQFIGRVNGTAANEMLGNSVNYFSFGPDALITSTTHANGALANAGALIRVADVNLGGGNIERGRVMGGSAGEFLGSFGFQVLSNGNYVVRSPQADVGGFVDAGSVLLASATTGNLVGRVNGTSANELLGNNGIRIATNGNYWIQSPNADTSAVDAGRLYLASAATGLALGNFDGDTANEFFSTNFEQNFSLGFDKAIVRAEKHGTNAGFVGLFDSVNLGGGNILVGSVAGAQNGDLVGNRATRFLSNGNYLVEAPNYINGSTIDAGSVFVVDNATGTSLLQIMGDTAGELLGDFGNVDTFTLGGIDNFLISSPENSGQRGSIFFVNGSDTASVLGTLTGVNINDNLGTDGIFSVAGGFLVPVSSASPGGAIDAGTVFLVDGTGTIINQQSGLAGDFYGQALDQFSISNTILVYNQNSQAGGFNSGQIVSLDPTTLNVNWTIIGSPGEQLGSAQAVQSFGFGSNFVIFSPFDDTFGLDSGRVILANPATGFVGHVAGQAANENLGSDAIVYRRSNGNYFIPSRFASPGAVNQAGSVYLADGTLGTLIGQVNGTAVFERLGSNINTSTTIFADDVLITSTSHMVGGNANAGTVIQAAATNLGGGNIIRGRINGGSAGEFFGSNGFTNLSNNNYVFLSPNADPLGRVDAGSAFLYNITTGSVVAQINGATAGDRIGSNGIRTTSNANFFMQNPNTDVAGVVDAGAVRLYHGASGALLGSLLGNNTGEFLGSVVSTLSGDDLMVRASAHTVGGLVGAGSVFRITNTNLGGGNITVGSVSGTSAGEGFGANFPNFFTDTMAVRSPGADIGGLADAGSVVFFDRNTFAVLSRINGTSANELFGNSGLSFITSTTRLIRSANADINGLSNAGSVVVVDILTGQELGRTHGISAEEMFGSLGPTFVTGGFIIRSPDADVGGLVDAGRVVQISSFTGMELQSLAGISAGERFGALAPVFLPSGKLLFGSPDADVGGVVDAGRIAFFDPTAVAIDPETGFTFDNLPFDDFFVTNVRLQNLLNGGASLTLQANNDITQMAGADIFATNGQLTLQAGRSIWLNAALDVPLLNLIANETEMNGVDLTYRGSGPGDVSILGPMVGGGTVNISADNLHVKRDTTMGAAAADLDARDTLTVNVAYDVTVEDSSITAGAATINAWNLNVLTNGTLLVENALVANLGQAAMGAAMSPMMMSPAMGGHFMVDRGTVTAGDLTVDATGDALFYNALVSTNTASVQAHNFLVQANALTEPQPSLFLAADSLSIVAEGVEVQAGSGVDAYAALVSLGSLSIDATTVEVFGGEGSGNVTPPLSEDLLTNSVGAVEGLAPFALIGAGTNLTVDTDSFTLEGGTADQSFAALASTGLFNLTAESGLLTAGAGANADAVLLALGGVAEIAVTTCTNCGQIFIDPLLDPIAQTGLYIAGVVQNPSGDAILAMTDGDDSASQDENENDDDDDEDDGPGECN